uniref:Uncharacterized protein n=1 Tax=Panagrolaimus sp. JU765 TaxID=591449 RepID=A0AC34QZY9_9BILA
MSKFESSPLPSLKPTVFPTGLCFHVRGFSKQNASDVFLLPSTDGKIQIITGNGKVEKTVDGHEGATLNAEWSKDGTSFATCGEDGLVKLWSRNGMLRSVLAQNARPVYALSLNNDSSKIAFCSARTVNSLRLVPSTCCDFATKLAGRIHWKN